MSATSARPPASTNAHEPCEECGAPLDAQQRYCVNCGGRRGNGANPSSRYFAAMSKRAHRPPPRPPARTGSGGRAAAVGFFALLPIAVAIGVVVGRSGNEGGENEALLEALRDQPATAGATAGSVAANATGKATRAKEAKKSTKGGGKVVAKTSNGTVHQVLGYKPPKKKVEEDTRIVEENPEQVGSNYIKAQQNIPDVVVVGGDPGSAPAAPAGGSEP
ncbi:MAG TPA: zinc ribbon domain-containing protein [Solirubrobacterales bacterium]|nr:zinc ribbon domain-containing protein [Solirubrobacterales bacterium]